MLGPGRHTITTANIPIIAGIVGWATGGQSPFRPRLCSSTSNSSSIARGTSEPLALRDPEFGMARLRAFGNYAFQVNNPAVFVNQIAGQQGIFSTGQAQALPAWHRGIRVRRYARRPAALAARPARAVR